MANSNLHVNVKFDQPEVRYRDGRYALLDIGKDWSNFASVELRTNSSTQKEEYHVFGIHTNLFEGLFSVLGMAQIDNEYRKIVEGNFNVVWHEL